jgi:hypothetical protein
MNPSRARDRIRELVRHNHYDLTVHATDRLVERDLVSEDVQSALVHSEASWLQEDGTWKVQGPDLDDQILTLIVDIQARVIVCADSDDKEAAPMDAPQEHVLVVTLFKGDEDE